MERLGKLVHYKKVTCLALTEVRKEVFKSRTKLTL
jgi:hypothetical protein